MNLKLLLYPLYIKLALWFYDKRLALHLLLISEEQATRELEVAYQQMMDDPGVSLTRKYKLYGLVQKVREQAPDHEPE